MTQGKLSINWLIRILGASAFAGLVAIIALVSQLVSSRDDDIASKTEQANQAIQIAQQQTQIALAGEQNQLQSQQLTLVAQQSSIEGQLLTPVPSDIGDSSLTAIAAIIRATQIEATSQAIATKQKGIEATQTAVASHLNLTFTVFANKAWQDTGITVNAGDVIIIQYVSGLWRWTGDRSDYDGNGDPAANGTYLDICTTNYDCPITDAPLDALVGRIGVSGTPFLIGNSITYTVPSGAGNNQHLYLMGNDSLSGLHDNVGSITVHIAK